MRGWLWLSGGGEQRGDAGGSKAGHCRLRRSSDCRDLREGDLPARPFQAPPRPAGTRCFPAPHPVVLASERPSRAKEGCQARKREGRRAGTGQTPTAQIDTQLPLPWVCLKVSHPVMPPSLCPWGHTGFSFRGSWSSVPEHRHPSRACNLACVRRMTSGSGSADPLSSMYQVPPKTFLAGDKTAPSPRS